MTQYIGDVPVSSVQEVNISKGDETDEIDLVAEDSNIVLTGNNEGQEIEIGFTLLKQTHPERLEVEEQRSELKGLASNDAEDNYFNYGKNKYFLAVEGVDVPESADLKTVREGTINAKALPWPKNLPQADIGNNKITSGNIVLQFSISGDSFRGRDFDGDISYSFLISSEPQPVRAASGKINYNFVLEELISEIQSIDGLLSLNQNFDGVNSTNKSNNGNINYTFSFRDIDGDSFGRDFGRFFGTSADSFSSLIINVLYSVTSQLNLSLNIIGEILQAPNLISDIFLQKELIANINQHISSEASVDYIFDSDDILIDMKHSSVGCWQFFLYSDGDLSAKKSANGDILTSMALISNANSEVNSEGSVDYILISFGKSEVIRSLISTIENTIDINGNNSTLYSDSGSVDVSALVNGESIKGRTFSSLIDYVLSLTVRGNTIVSNNADVDYVFSLSGEIENENGQFGRFFGRSFGGTPLIDRDSSFGRFFGRGFGGN